MSKKPKVLVICRYYEVPMIEEGAKNLKDYSIEIETISRIWNMGTIKYIEEMIKLLDKNPTRYEGIVGTSDITSVFANVLVESTKKPGTSVDSMINCQNKYISRKIQEKYIPESTPRFWLDSEFLRDFPLDPPFFAKPVRANMQYSSKKMNSYDELRKHIKDKTEELVGYNKYYLDALQVTSHLRNQENFETCNKFLCEELIPGNQVTVNGYVYEGNVRIFGIAKAAFWENMLSFSHHEFPYKPSDNMEKKVKDITKRVVKGLGLNNTHFNIEMRLDEENEKAYIIEVNCRIAFQFVKMIEAVTGINLVKTMCDLALGKEPDEEEIELERTYPYCFNFELRKFANKEITRIPTETDFQKIQHVYPEVTVKNLVKANTRLSDYKHNMESFRYCMIDVPGDSREEIMEKYDKISSMLGYEFTNQLKKTNPNKTCQQRSTLFQND